MAPAPRGVLTVEIGPAVRDSLGAPQRGNASFVGGFPIGEHYPRFVPHVKTRNPTLTLRYDSWSSGDTTSFAGRLPYRDDVLNGRQIEGIGIGYDGYFSWEYPKLGVHVVNNTNRTYQLSQAIVTVERSDLDVEPIPIFDAEAFSLGWPDPTSAIDSGVPDRLGLRLVNNGWGPVINPRIRFALGYGEHGESLWALGPGNVELPFVATAATIDSLAFVPLEDSIVGRVRTSDYLTPDFFAAADSVRVRGGDFWLTVVGVLDYRTAAGLTRSVPFRTAIQQTGGFGAGFDENTYPYDICLSAGKVGSYQIRLAQHVKAGETDRFSITLGSDRSARFIIHVAVRATGGELFDAGSAVVDVFVPSRRGEADRWCTTDQGAVPISTEFR